MAKIATTEVITAALNGRSVLLSDKLSSDYTTMTEDQILNGTGVAAMVSDIKKNNAFGDGASATTGGAIGDEASATQGGALGYKASATGNGGAIGTRTTAFHGGAIGYQASAGSGGAIGQVAECVGGAAVGWGAKTSEGAALGKNAVCKSGNTKIDAIQLGAGTNSTVKSMQVYSTPLLIPDGNGGLVIPLSLIRASYNAADTTEQDLFKQALGIS